MPKLSLTLDEALKFYDLTEDALFVRGTDEHDRPIYAVALKPDRVVFVLKTGPKLMYPPQTRDHCDYVPKKRRAEALQLAGLATEQPETEEDEDISPLATPKRRPPRPAQ